MTASDADGEPNRQSQPHRSRAIRQRLRDASTAERRALVDELARAAQHDDDEAAADLAWAILELRLARPSIGRYLMRDADVQAAEQATLVAVAFRLAGWRGEAAFTTWLDRVAANEAKQLIRSEGRHSSRAADDDPEALTDDRVVGRISSMITDSELVRQAIAALPERHRRALTLREDEGLEYAEIARRLEIPVGTAKTWVRRGRAELATALTAALATRREPPAG